MAITSREDRSARKILWLLVIAGLALRVLALFASRDFLIAYRLPDDALYYFGIAKHIALGQGISVDGVHPNNGFHPFWLVAILPIFLLHLSDWSAIYGVLLLQTILDAIIIWLIGVIVLRLLSGRTRSELITGVVLSAGSYALNPIAIIRGINGLETTITAAFLLLWSLAFVRLWKLEWSAKRITALSVMSGLLFLARTDMAVIMAFSLFFLCIYRWSVLAATWRQALFSAIFALAIIFPWLLWNYATFGSILQVSAESVPFVAQRKFDLLYGATGKYGFLSIEALRNMLKPFVYTCLGLPLLTLIALVFTRRRTAEDQNQSGLERSLGGLLVIVCGALFLLAFHTIVRGFIRDWYIEDLMPLFAIVFAISSVLALKRWTGNAIRTMLYIVSFATLVVIGFGELRSPRYNSQKAVVYEGVEFVRHLPPDSRVGAFNSGWYAYFAPENVRVVNLDGVVNPDAFHFIKTGKLHDYLREDSIRYLLDFRGDIDGFRGLMDQEFTAEYALDSTLSSPKSVDSLLVLKRK